MVEIDTIDDVVELFNNTDGINAHSHVADPNRALVKVQEEGAIGQFFKLCREHDLKRESTTRDCLKTPELDSWVDL